MPLVGPAAWLGSGHDDHRGPHDEPADDSVPFARVRRRLTRDVPLPHQPTDRFLRQAERRGRHDRGLHPAEQYRWRDLLAVRLLRDGSAQRGPPAAAEHHRPRWRHGLGKAAPENARDPRAGSSRARGVQLQRRPERKPDVMSDLDVRADHATRRDRLSAGDAASCAVRERRDRDRRRGPVRASPTAPPIPCRSASWACSHP